MDGDMTGPGNQVSKSLALPLILCFPTFTALVKKTDGRTWLFIRLANYQREIIHAVSIPIPGSTYHTTYADALPLLLSYVTGEGCFLTLPRKPFHPLTPTQGTLVFLLPLRVGFQSCRSL
jgi:hypothetical protein